MKKDRKYKWYIIDVIVFSLINIFLWRIIVDNGINLDVLVFQNLTTLNFIIFGLAVYRLADIITKEYVTDFIRAPFVDIENDRTGFKDFAMGLLGCPSCMGVWVAMTLFYCYVFFPIPTSAVIIISALSALERYGSKIYNFFDNRE